MGLDLKTKELVAIGASVVAGCQPCMKYHFKAAKDSGATEEEIKDAIDTVQAVKMESVTVLDKFAEELLGESQRPSSERHPDKKGSESGKCCG